MKKVFHFDSPREAYHADAAVVWCYDHRVHQAFAKFLKRKGVVKLDVIKIAGGAKSLASPELESDRVFVMDQICKSIRLHGTRLVILMLHSDCGAYGGLATFDNDPKTEAQLQEQELQLAARRLKETVPELDVQAYFVDFEGVWAVDLDS